MTEPILEDLRVAYWRLNKALMEVMDLCPDSDPGPSKDPVWHDWVHEGNQDDVAYSCRDEALWQVRGIVSSALYEGAVLADYEQPVFSDPSK